MKISVISAALLFIASMPMAGTTSPGAPKKTQAELDRKNGFKGEYILTRSTDPICVPFTKNLNQFRKLDFDTCDPRLSDQYPEFSRPNWKQVPLDLDIAELAFKGYGGSGLKKGEGVYWLNWLAETADLRAAGQVKMWVTEVDINNDGIPDPIARVQYANPAKSLPVKQRECMYSNSGLWKLSPNAKPLYSGLSHFYFGRDADIILYKTTGQSYSLEWSEGQAGPILQGRDIGATRGIIVSNADASSSPAEVCNINWVPTGNYRPLKSSGLSKR